MSEIHFLDWHYFNFESFGSTYLSRFVLGVLLILFSLLSTSLHLFWNVVMSWSVSINRALLSLFYDLHCEFTCLYDLHFGCTCPYDLFPRTEDYTVEFQVWMLSCFPAVADPDTVEESEQWRVPFPVSQASCRVSFSPCCSYAEVARILLTLISPICAWKSKTYRHRIVSA